MKVAVVLHAHLPWVRATTPWTVEERWFHDAMWTCYLPLLDVFDDEGPVTLSLSPTLLEMLGDRTLAARFETHLDALDELNHRHRGRPDAPFYARRIAGARARFRHPRGDVVTRLAAAAARGRIELWTTAVTHGYLPGLGLVNGSVAAQVRLGRDVFARALGGDPSGFWLPECGIDRRVVDEVTRAGLDAPSVLDAHAIPRAGRTAGGWIFWPRHLHATHRVWSRAHGYPGHAHYREFHRDLGHEIADPSPFGAGTMTGLKPYRIDGGPYRSREAETQAKRHAADFVTWLAQAATTRASPLLVAFDAELFGHWWFEGPTFLREVLAGIDGHPRLGLATVSQLEPPPGAPVSPEPSSWGRGGDHRVWVGPRTARLWRHIHATARQLAAAVAATPPETSSPGLDHALREGLLLQASDWAFALEDGQAAAYAASRVRAHRRGVAAGLEAWRRGADVAAAPDAPGFLEAWRGESLRAAFRALAYTLDHNR
ncbi:MAG: 1,4-alpha-glucan branching protein domain-containing protein [Myxococcota bacterium]